MNTGIVDLIWRNDQRMGTLIITCHRGIAPRKQKQQTFINEQKTRAIQDLDLVGSQPEDAQGNR